MVDTLTEGKKAPAFKLPSSSGVDVSLASLKGEKAVLFFYPKDDTSGCTREAIDFTSHLGAFKKAGTRILGISPDTLKKHDKFIEKHELKVELLSDESKTMLESYGVWKEKSMYGRKYMGVERTTILIDPAGKISKIWNKVKVPGHVEDVLEAAKAL